MCVAADRFGATQNRSIKNPRGTTTGINAPPLNCGCPECVRSDVRCSFVGLASEAHAARAGRASRIRRNGENLTEDVYLTMSLGVDILGMRQHSRSVGEMLLCEKRSTHVQPPAAGARRDEYVCLRKCLLRSV